MASAVDAPVSLTRLQSIGSLTLRQAADGGPPALPALRSVEDRLDVGTYVGSADLSSLVSVRTLRVSGDMALDELTEVYTVQTSTELISMPEAPKLTRITAGILLEGKLQDLALLRRVTQVGGLDLNAPALASLDGLSALTMIGPPDTSGTGTVTSGGLRLCSCDRLTDLLGLGSLIEIHGDIEIVENFGLN